MKGPQPCVWLLLVVTFTGLWPFGNPAGAQWLNYPAPGIPRTPDGKPDMTAPVPRLGNGKPDLSGIWTTIPLRPCPPAGCNDMPITEQFLNIGWSMPEPLPLQAWAAEQIRATVANNRANDPLSRCLPVGPVRLHTMPGYRKIIHVPAQVTILNETHVSYREIYTDGRPLPIDPNPTWNGYSIGSWDGDTLVVRTAGFRTGVWLDGRGAPLTPEATITERFRRTNFGSLEIQITVDDSAAYMKPWTTTIRQQLAPDTQLLDYVCVENERSLQHMVGVPQ